MKFPTLKRYISLLDNDEVDFSSISPEKFLNLCFTENKGLNLNLSKEQFLYAIEKFNNVEETNILEIILKYNDYYCINFNSEDIIAFIDKYPKTFEKYMIMKVFQC